jgi:DNA polymerase III subunit chi
MTEILFYHLERASLDSVLPGLLEKTLERGWKAVVRTGSRERLEALDNHLWTYRDEAFLPHGAGGEGERHPIWLTDGDDAPNDPQILFLVDGARTDPSGVGDLERCVMIFDGDDEPAVTQARGFWKATAAAGHVVTYWKQTENGRWEKQG